MEAAPTLKQAFSIIRCGHDRRLKNSVVESDTLQTRDFIRKFDGSDTDRRHHCSQRRRAFGKDAVVQGFNPLWILTPESNREFPDPGQFWLNSDSAPGPPKFLLVFRFRTSRARSQVPNPLLKPASLTLPPTKCLHSPPYDHPKMDKSSTPGAGGGDQATSGEPQYIRARVQSACDGCKARKGR